MVASVTFTFVAGSDIDSGQINQNFSDLVNYLNSLVLPTTPVPIAQGGTGATNAAQALINLGAMAALPSGVMMMSGTIVPPAGWLLCDGSAVSRATYANLFTAIGTAFGTGDGTTTFNLPDMRGRVPAGYDAGNASGRLTLLTSQGCDASSVGNNGGEQAHQQTIGEMASHGHLVTDPGHSHTVTAVGSVTAPVNVSGANGVNPNPASSLTTSTATTGLTIQAEGANHNSNVVQPTLIVAYIIKT